MQIKQSIKNAGKRTIKKTIHITKKSLDVSPKTKEKLKKLIVSSVNFSVPSNEYQEWLLRNTPDGIELYKQREKIKSFSYQPLISVIVPTYNTPEVFFREMADSVLAQTYDNWELVLVDDASPDDTVRKLIKEYAKKDNRIVYKFLDDNHHIAGATNEGIAIAQGEFVSLLDHDDILWPNALYEVVKALNNNKKLNFIYSDEDKVDGNDRFAHKDPFFKPDWSPELLRSANYITHFTTIRKSVLDKFGYEDGSYNGTQDWELFLRITRNIKADTIYHINKILYSWRVHDKSTAKSVGVKPYVIEAQRRALEADVVARGLLARVKMDKSTNYWSIGYNIVDNPKVSIVIPTKDQYKITRRCIESIYQKTTYKNFEIILVDTGSTDSRVLSWYKTLKDKYGSSMRIVDFIEDKFSYARSCNYGASLATGNLLIMLNNDMEIITPDWIEHMAGYAQQKNIGAVGIKLLYPDKLSIQHAGVGIGIGGCASNLFVGLRDDNDSLSLTQSITLRTTRNVSAVTAACLMIRKETYDALNGFREEYRINYNDVDLCLRIIEAGYRNVYLSDVKLLHYESISRGKPEDTKKHDSKEFKDAQKKFKKHWNSYIEGDPYVNTNISRKTATFDIAIEA